MFTGLIQEMGTITAVIPTQDGSILHLEMGLAAKCLIGDSLSVNGVCLTITERTDRHVCVTAVAETVSRTTLGQCSVGRRVNLELALRAGDALGGHLVQGHVDGTATLTRIAPRGVSTELTFRLGEGLERYVVEKGSIAIDGISLTVARIRDAFVTVAIIPHTMQVTNLSSLHVGDVVNIEVDILAKYVERLLGMTHVPSSSRLSESWIREQGFGS